MEAVPSSPAEVGVGDLFDALRYLGSPTVLDPMRRPTPGDGDIPLLLGAVSCAAERLAVLRQGTRLGEWQAWAAGWLGTAGVGRGPGGARSAFELLAMRIQVSESLLTGYASDAELVALVRACLKAAAGLAVLHTDTTEAGCAADAAFQGQVFSQASTALGDAVGRYAALKAERGRGW